MTPALPGGKKGPSCDLIADRIAEHANARDLDVEAVAFGQPAGRIAPHADARGRAAGDDVPGLQRYEAGGIFNEPRDREGHVRGVIMLAPIAVDTGLELEREGDGVGRHHPRAHRSARLEVLPTGSETF